VGRLVELETTVLLERRIGALPIVNAFLSRMGIEALLDAHVPANRRALLAPSVSLMVVLRMLVIERAPVYKLTEWAAGRDPALLGLAADEVQAINDDRVGRALDGLFEADRASMLTKLICHVVAAFSVNLDELHNDGTTLQMQGAYSDRTGDSPLAPRVRFGHAKERPDLAQLIFLLTVSSDGYVPITYRLVDGNASEDRTHIETWKACCGIAGTTRFLYVSDCKLCSREAMGYIDKQNGRFCCVMPASRAEVGEFRRFIASSSPAWTEAMRVPGRRKDDPEDIYAVTPHPSPSADGYRIVWVHSTEKRSHDAELRRRAIEAARVALSELDKRLSGPRCRLKDERSVVAAANAAIEDARATRWVSAKVSTTTVVSHRQQRRGRPGPNTVYLRVEESAFSVTCQIADEVVRDDACFDGCWPMMTNDREMSEVELLLAMKRQPGVENRHHVLKGVVELLPLYLKSNERIDAFAFLGFVAVLVHALIEKELRQAMRDGAIANLPLYPEERACAAPTAARVLEVFEPLCAHELVGGASLLKGYDPNLSNLHHQLLELLKVPVTAYRARGIASA
jgi:transposase